MQPHDHILVLHASSKHVNWSARIFNTSMWSYISLHSSILIVKILRFFLTRCLTSFWSHVCCIIYSMLPPVLCTLWCAPTSCPPSSWQWWQWPSCIVVLMPSCCCHWQWMVAVIPNIYDLPKIFGGQHHLYFYVKVEVLVIEPINHYEFHALSRSHLIIQMQAPIYSMYHEGRRTYNGTLISPKPIWDSHQSLVCWRLRWNLSIHE